MVWEQMMDYNEKYKLALQRVSDLLHNEEVEPLMAELAEDPELARLDQTLRALRGSLSMLAEGNLSGHISSDGFLCSHAHVVQNKLQDLCFLCRTVANGDLSQHAEGFGDVSDAMNKAIKSFQYRAESLHHAEGMLRELFESYAETVALVKDGEILLVNALKAEQQKIYLSDMPGKRLLDIIIAEDREMASRRFSAMESGHVFNDFIVLRIVRNGHVCRQEVRGCRIDWYGEKALLLFFRDASQRGSGESPDLSEDGYRLMAENARDVIWVLDIESGRYKYVSPSVYAMRGVTAEQVMQEDIRASMTPDSYTRFFEYLNRQAEAFRRDPSSVSNEMIEVDRLTKDGALVYTEVSVKLRYGADGHVEAVGISRDITSRKDSERQILYLNYHDPLTELYNRRYYQEHLNKLKTSDHLPLSLVLIDVNCMKLMNDAFGHLTGDDLLISFSAVLKETLRSSDVAARIGGDEFALLLPRTGGDVAVRIVERIRGALTRKEVLDLSISAAFGIATLYRAEDDFDAVYRLAEENMYREKLMDSRELRKGVLHQVIENLYKKCENERRHSTAVSSLCASIGRGFRLSDKEVQELSTLGMYHDIGKVTIDERILNKPNALNPEEFVEIRRHPETSYQILKPFSGMGDVAEYALMHHRWVNGKGYPELTGKLPLPAKILSVAEAFDVMTGQYPYQRAMSVDRAIRELKNRSGSQFDGKVVDMLAGCVRNSKR